MTLESSHWQDKIVILKRIPLFAACTDQQLYLIAKRTRLVEYKKEEVIYREGDPADSFYIVSSGRLRVFSLSHHVEKTLAILYNGDSFGEISLLTGEKHSATVQALNDTLVLELKKEDFNEVINRIPSLVLYLSRLLSKRLRTREDLPEPTDTTIASITSATRGVGCTLFAVSLAAMLKHETNRQIVLVNMTNDPHHWAWRFKSSRPSSEIKTTLTNLVLEEQLDNVLDIHPLGFLLLSAGELLSDSQGEHTVAPLLNALTKRFHYVLVDLPAEATPPVLKALTQSDLIYVVTNPDSDHLAQTRMLIHQITSVVSTTTQRVQVVLNQLQDSEEKTNFLSMLLGGPPRGRDVGIAEQLGRPVTFTLPFLPLADAMTIESLAQLLEERRSAYALTVQRVARKLSGGLVGLALGSGAALGLAHIGVLKVLEREKIPIDIIAGSSIGALIGGLWASGRSVEEIEHMALRFKHPWDINKLFLLDVQVPLVSVVVAVVMGLVVWPIAGIWTALLASFVCVIMGLILGPLSGGPIQGAQLMARLQADFQNRTFEDTWIPVKIVAANPMTREEVIIDSGSLAEAVRASVSIPGIFKPIRFGGDICLDGGVVNPIPVSVLKQAGANRVIAVNVFPNIEELRMHRQKLQQRRQQREAQLASRSFPIRFLVWLRHELIQAVSPLVFDVIMRSMQWMEYQIAEISCREADLTLRPTVPDSHWLEFFSPEKFIRRGEEIAMAYLPEIKRIAGLRELSVDKPVQDQYTGR